MRWTRATPACHTDDGDVSVVLLHVNEMCKSNVLLSSLLTHFSSIKKNPVLSLISLKLLGLPLIYVKAILIILIIIIISNIILIYSIGCRRLWFLLSQNIPVLNLTDFNNQGKLKCVARSSFYFEKTDTGRRLASLSWLLW